MAKMKTFYLILAFSLFCALSFSSVIALNFIDCNLVSSDIKDVPHGRVYTHADFTYSQTQYNFSSPVLTLSNMSVSIVPVDSKHSPTYALDLKLNDQLVVNAQHALVYSINGFNVSCDARNHLLYKFHDYYEQYALVKGESTLVAEEFCSFSYELFIYNPPCPTVS